MPGNIKQWIGKDITLKEAWFSCSWLDAAFDMSSDTTFSYLRFQCAFKFRIFIKFVTLINELQYLQVGCQAR